MYKIRHIAFCLLVTYSCVFLSSCTDKSEDTLPANSGVIASLSILEKNNSIENDIIGEIDHNKRSVSLFSYQWIDNIERIVPTFETKGSITVDNSNIISDKSTIDLSKRTSTWKITSQEGEVIEYEINLICPQTTGLPIIKIKIEDNIEIAEKTDEYYNAQISIIDKMNPTNSLESAVGIRGRGNSTWKYPKKPYRIKFDKKTSLFGLGAEKSWVLLANYLDPSLLMTSLAFEVGHRVGARYTNHEIPCELFVNNTYRGHYTLTEQVQVNTHRVNVDKSKGFLIAIDHYYDDTPKFRSAILQLPIMIKSPDANSMNEVDWIREYFNQFETELMKDFPISKYKDYLDIHSVIDYMLVNEITCNGDLYPPKSLFIHKDIDSKMSFGPVWDFDWAYGKNTGKGEFIFFENPNKTIFSPIATTEQAGCQLFTRFLQDPTFFQLYKDRWNQLKSEGALNFDEFINNRVEDIYYSQMLNFKKWDNRLDFDEQIEKMRSWLNHHIDYVDQTINNNFDVN